MRPRFSPPARFLWPQGHRYAAMLCFDVDGETTALSEDPKLAARRTLMSQCEYGPRVGVPRLLGLLRHLEVPATFFVPGYILEQHPRMVEAILADGHEIGLHSYGHEKLAYLSEAEEEAIIVRCLALFQRYTGVRPVGHRAPWFETNPWTSDLLQRHGLLYDASEMGDDVPYIHPSGLVQIPGQWLLEDWEQFAFNADPAWGFIPENCAKVYDLWWRECEAMHQFGCCFVLTMHPWLTGRPSRVRMLEELITAMQEQGGVWFARGREIAEYVRAHPEARRETDLDFVLDNPADCDDSLVSPSASLPSMPILPSQRSGRVRLLLLVGVLATLAYIYQAQAIFYWALYAPEEGDVIFQSLPHGDLVDAIEGITKSPYSHCGVVLQEEGRWVVLEAIGSVHSTPLLEWIARGRKAGIAVFRLEAKYREYLPQFKQEIHRFDGRPYDYDYAMLDGAIYCSELPYKAFLATTGEPLGRLQRLQELNWEPSAPFIKSIQGGELPLDREMITPVALSQAPQLHEVFRRGF